MVATIVTQWTAGHESRGVPPGAHARQVQVMVLSLSPAVLGTQLHLSEIMRHPAWALPMLQGHETRGHGPCFGSEPNLWL